VRAVARVVDFAVRLVNGLTWSRGLTLATALSLIWTVSIFAAPFTQPPGTVALSANGGANRIDNAALYGGYNGYAQAVYFLSDIQCHQMPQRSLYLNENQMPLDARMTSIYAFMNLGLLSAALIVPASTLSQGILNVLPHRPRRWVRDHLRVDVGAFLLILATLLPVAVDGFTQLFEWRESTNELRVLTGAFTGWGTGLLLGVMFTSLKQFELEMRAVRATRGVDQRL